MDKNYYKTLGISRSATEDEIKKAYRNLALKYHPDKNKSADAEEIFKRVGVAYRILVDRRKREIYGKMESKRKNTARRNGSDDNDMKNQGGGGNKATSKNHQDSYSKSQKDNCNRKEERKSCHTSRRSYRNPTESNYFWNNECQTNWHHENRDSDTGRNSFSFFGGSGGRGQRGGFFWKNDFQQKRFGFKYERDEETARMRDERKKSEGVGCEKQRAEHFGREKGNQQESKSTRNNAERTRQRAELAREKRQRTKEWKRRTRERAEKFREKWTRNYGERANVH